MKILLSIILFNLSLILCNDLILVDDKTKVEQVNEKFEISDEEFIPSHEWQKIKPGQAIPKGLHVRLNVQTGEREAKLLSPDDSKPKFEESIKKIDDEPIPQKTQEELIHEEQVRKKFKSYDQLKQDLNDLNLNVKTDFEIIKNLLEKFQNSSRDEKITILKDLEYYVHQYDNGLLLCDIGGFDLILKELNTTISDPEYAENLILVLGSAVQSNPKVKVFAIKTELLQILLSRLSGRVLTDELYSKFIFTLSGLLRNFPFAQSKFLRLGGVEILSNLIKQMNSIKLKVKILTLTDDLVREKVKVLAEPDRDSETFEQYKKLNLVEELIEKNWCENYSELLEKSQDHDSREKILDSMMTLIKECRIKFSDSKFVKLLSALLKEYETLLKEDGDDDYFSRFTTNLGTILNEINFLNSKQDL